jgi:hypothetical protein
MTDACVCGGRLQVALCRAAVFAVLATSLVHAQAPQPVQPASSRVALTVTTLEGTVRMPGVDVELREAPDGLVLARTVTDGAGQVTFPDVPPGRYLVSASRPGFVSRNSAPFDVKPAAVVEVLLDIQLTFVMPAVEVRAESPSPTDSVQPVSMSDMLAGSVMELAPLEGDDFQGLLPLLPGVVRGSDGRLRIKGGQPTQGALQVSSASLIDPSSGDFDLELPGQSIDSVEVLANPFSAEYGRFSTSIVQIRTRRGTNEWDVSQGNLMPRFRKDFSIRGFEPRFSVRGPLKRDRVFLSQDFQFRFVNTPVRSLPDEPEIRLMSLDSFTRIDSVFSSRHSFGGGIVAFPREVERVTMNTFRPPEVTPQFNQEGVSVGVVDRFAVAAGAVLETTVSVRGFEIDVNSEGREPMIYGPQTQSGSFFNDQERDVRSVQWVEALSLTKTFGGGQHVFKFGTDVQRSWYHGASASRPIEIRRLDGSLAERTTFGAPTAQDISGLELAVFGQDHWRIGSRLTLELGMRLDRDATVERLDWSPRAGAAFSLLPEGRAILRGGFGRFVQRTPLNVEAFPTYEGRTVSRFAADGSPLGVPIVYRNVLDANLNTPGARVGNVELDQRFGRRVLLKVAFLHRIGSHEYLLTPDPAAGVLRVTSSGASRYQELEATTRYLGGGRRDLTFSYVWAKGTADLNFYDHFFGNFRNPIVRNNEYNLIPTDVRHRLIVRGTIGLPGQWDLAPVIEVRSGFPWSAVDEFLDFVGPRNRAGRLPAVGTVDFALTRPWRVKKYRFRAGLKVYNLLGVSAARDVQNNLTSPQYGTYANPIERSIGLSFGVGK